MAAALLMELLRQGFTCRYDDCHAWSVRRTRGGNFFFFFLLLLLAVCLVSDARIQMACGDDH